MHVGASTCGNMAAQERVASWQTDSVLNVFPHAAAILVEYVCMILDKLLEGFTQLKVSEPL